MTSESTASDGPVSGRSAAAWLARDLFSAGAARELVNRLCETWGIPAVGADAQVVATELVENAVRHAGTGCELVVGLDGDGLTVAVSDGVREIPEVRHPSAQEVGGRGLVLVENMCREWGFEITDTGKRVWATLDVHDAGPGRVDEVRSS